MPSQSAARAPSHLRRRCDPRLTNVCRSRGARFARAAGQVLAQHPPHACRASQPATSSSTSMAVVSSTPMPSWFAKGRPTFASSWRSVAARRFAAGKAAPNSLLAASDTVEENLLGRNGAHDQTWRCPRCRALSVSGPARADVQYDTSGEDLYRIESVGDVSKVTYAGAHAYRRGKMAKRGALKHALAICAAVPMGRAAARRSSFKFSSRTARSTTESTTIRIS